MKQIFVQSVTRLVLVDGCLVYKNSTQYHVVHPSRELVDKLYEAVPDAIYVGSLISKLVDIDKGEERFTTRHRRSVTIWSENSRDQQVITDILKEYLQPKEDED